MIDRTPHPPELADDDQRSVALERQNLLNVGYRLLGSFTEAEDAVQEAYSRWYALDPEQRRSISAPGAWLTTVTTRVCLDMLKSARVRRERYVGEWIPEPLPLPSPQAGHVGPGVDPADRITLDESVRMAMLVVLDAMTPRERVAFVLHDVFRYPYADIAAMVGRSPEACRQLASSARKRISEGTVADTPLGEQTALVEEFRRAWEAQDIDGLVGLLDPAATLATDSGGVVNAVRRPVSGGPELARFLVRLAHQGAELGVEVAPAIVNGQPGLTGRLGDRTIMVLSFDIVAGHVRRLWATVNPDKLVLWNGEASTVL
jgi:RNA polymerase sigma-70 factor (ECF subfamily)